MLIAFAHIIVIDIKISLFRNGYAGMTKDFAQSVNIHTVHQTPLCEIVPQAMGRILFVQSRPLNVLAEVPFKISYTDGTAVFFHREQIITFHISILELKPTAEGFFCFG